MNVYELSKSFTAEFTGSLFLSLFIGWSELNLLNDEVDLLLLAFVQFTAVAAISWTIATFSGAVLNPLITASLGISKRLKGYKLLSYFVAQLVGTLGGTLLLRLLAPFPSRNRHIAEACFGCLRLTRSVGFISAIIAEILGGFLLVFAFYASMIDKRATRGMYGLGVGLVYMVMAFSFGKYMNIGINPFRYLAGVLINGQFGYWYVYLTGCIIGAGAATRIFEDLVMVDQPKVGENHVKFE